MHWIIVGHLCPTQEGTGPQGRVPPNAWEGTQEEKEVSQALCIFLGC